MQATLSTACASIHNSTLPLILPHITAGQYIWAVYAYLSCIAVLVYCIRSAFSQDNGFSIAYNPVLTSRYLSGSTILFGSSRTNSRSSLRSRLAFGVYIPMTSSHASYVFNYPSDNLYTKLCTRPGLNVWWPKIRKSRHSWIPLVTVHVALPGNQDITSNTCLLQCRHD